MLSSEGIGKRSCKDFKSTHPWLTEEVLQSIKAKHDAEGTEQEKMRTEECSAKIMIAREAYIKRTKRELKAMKGKCKEWWKKTNALSGAPAKTCSIPPLKNSSNEWVLEASAKATPIAETQLRKCTLAEEEQNKYSKIKREECQQDFVQLPTVEMAYKELSALNETSATGSDTVPARILKLVSLWNHPPTLEPVKGCSF